MTAWDVAVPESELADARADAEARMVSTCDVGRQSGTSTTVDRLKVPAWTRVHTATPFRLAASGTSDGGRRSVTIGDVVYETATAVGHLPATLTDLADGDVLAITAGEWSGTFWRVVKATMKDQATARRVPIEQATRPAGWPS